MRIIRYINSEEADFAALQAAEEKEARLAAEEPERKMGREARELQRKIDREDREREEVKERVWLEALAEVAKKQCWPIMLTDAPRKRGRPRKSEEEKAAAAEIRKLRKQRGDEGASARRDKPSAELQLRIRAQVLEAPDAKSKPSATFWKSEADKWGLTVQMLKNICSEKAAQKAQALVEAQRKERPGNRGKGRCWKKFVRRAEGRRVGQFDERGKMKTKTRDFPHLWERLRQWYQLESAKGRRWSAEDAAENFKKELEDDISSVKIKGESSSPDELCRIQLGERRLENLKKKHNWKHLVACTKWELQIVHRRKGRRDTKEEIK